MAYLTNFHQASYNPAADANQNGQVGLVDGKLLLRNETPLTPKIPLEVNLALAPRTRRTSTPRRTRGARRSSRT